MRPGTIGVVFALLLAGSPLSSSGQDPAQTKSAPAPRAAAREPNVLVRVNGRPITEAQLEFLFLSRQIPENLRPAARKGMIESLIDQQLVREFLADRRADATPTQIELQVRRIRQLISERGENPDEVFARIGYDDAALRRDLALPLSWFNHVRRVVTPERLREYFAAHRTQFDGTEVRVSHILLKLDQNATPEDERAAHDRLSQFREEIVSGKTTFTAVAEKFSQAPSAQQGGDLGFISYRGSVPESVAEAAFLLEKGDVSQPIRTHFGLHLVTVTDRKPGQLSLEDVRPAVLETLSNELWKETVKDLRGRAKIEWLSSPEPE